MKIKIVATIDVDPGKWAAEYGIERKEVREDVKAYFESSLQERIKFLGLEPENMEAQQCTARLNK